MDGNHNTVVYPPNKSLERKLYFSNTPVIYDFLLFIEFNSQGRSIVGCSSLNGTVWEGTTLYFEDEAQLLSLKNQKSYIGSTVSDGKFLTDDRIVLGEDTGVLNVLSVNPDVPFLEWTTYFQHQSRVPKLAVWNNSPQVLTCSGNSLFIWQIDKERKPIFNFENYHTETVNYVDTVKSEPTTFVSAGTDRKCCIWDHRQPVAAKVLYRNEFASLTSVACNQTKPNYFIVGSEGGDVYLLDRRVPKDFISVSSCNFKIHRILFNESNKFAVCGDNNQILVFQCDEEILSTTYCNDTHKSIVRGLSWYKDNLYSCGFDKQIVKHHF